MASYDGGDQGFLNAYFHGWFASSSQNRLSFRYNMQQHMAWLYPPAWSAVSQPVIIHFCGGRKQKPWNVHDSKKSPELIQPYIQKWWSFYSASLESLAEKVEL